MSTTKYVGTCLCEGIRFTISSEPTGVTYCHCEHCRKGAGGTGQVMGTFAKDDLKFESGEDLISTYVFTQTTTGNPKDKTFCKQCGVPLWTVTGSSRRNNQLFVRAALLDKGSDLKPQVEIFTKGRPSWDKGVGVSEYETLP